MSFVCQGSCYMTYFVQSACLVVIGCKLTFLSLDTHTMAPELLPAMSRLYLAAVE